MSFCKRYSAIASLLGASLIISFGAHAEHVKVVSGLMGAQDDDSKKLLTLSPDDANKTATHDLLSVLRPTGKFMVDNSRNVEAMMFTTIPYETDYRYVCRQDLITLRYKLVGRHNAAGEWSGFGREPAGVESQQTYHIEQLPVPGAVPGASYQATVCDATHPDTAATWFAAPSAEDAVRAANMFRMAEDQAKAGRLRLSHCDSHGTDTCQNWMLSLDDPSKITSIERCETKKDDDACYVISLSDVDITISGTIPRTVWEEITPTVIKSVRIDAVMTISE